MRFSIELDLDNLKPHELALLSYVHDHQAEVCQSSIARFAQAVGVAPATVTRFCQKLGFSGFPELKFYIKTLMKTEDTKVLQELDGSKPALVSLEQAKAALTNDIEGTAGFLNTEQLTKVCELLLSGNAIYLFTPGGLTDLCVTYLERGLLSLGIPQVYTFRSSRSTRRMVQELEPGQLFMFISNSGCYKPTLELAREAKVHGMQVVSMSSTEHNDLAELSCYSLRYFNKERAILGADFSTRTCAFIAIRMLIEHLAELMASQQEQL